MNGTITTYPVIGIQTVGSSAARRLLAKVRVHLKAATAANCNQFVLATLITPTLRKGEDNGSHVGHCSDDDRHLDKSAELHTTDTLYDKVSESWSGGTLRLEGLLDCGANAETCTECRDRRQHGPYIRCAHKHTDHMGWMQRIDALFPHIPPRCQGHLLCRSGSYSISRIQADRLRKAVMICSMSPRGSPQRIREEYLSV